MYEFRRIADIMTPRAIRIRPGHYVDTEFCGDKTFYLWVRHGHEFYSVNIESQACIPCKGKCKKLRLNEQQLKTVPNLLKLLGAGE